MFCLKCGDYERSGTSYIHNMLRCQRGGAATYRCVEYEHVIVEDFAGGNGGWVGTLSDGGGSATS